MDARAHAAVERADVEHADGHREEDGGVVGEERDDGGGHLVRLARVRVGERDGRDVDDAALGGGHVGRAGHELLERLARLLVVRQPVARARLRHRPEQLRVCARALRVD